MSNRESAQVARRIVVVVACLIVAASLAETSLLAGAPQPDGWQGMSPRDEIRPEFGWKPNGGPDGHGAFLIKADAR